MTRRSLSCRFVASALGVASIAISPSAGASGFISGRFGSDHGNPVGENPFAIYFNPAALSGVHGTQIALDSSFLYRHATFDRPASSLSPNALRSPTSPGYAAYQQSNTGRAKLDNLLAVPFLGAATDFGSEQFFGGIASYVPFGGIANWSRPGPANAPGGDGPQRWSDMSGTFLSIYNTAAFGVRIPEQRLSFAVSASGVVSRISSLRARNVSGSDDVKDVAGSLVEGRALVEATGVHLAAAVGAFWEPLEDHSLKLGASYTARPGFGEMRWKGTVQTVVASSVPSKSDIDLVQTYPDVFRVGGSYQVSSNVQVRADIEYVTWSAMKRQCIVPRGGSCNVNASTGSAEASSTGIILNLERRWKNAGNVRVGGSYFLDDGTELFGSFAVDTSAIPDSTLDATFMDALKLMPTVGASHKFGERFALGASYTDVYFMTRDTTGKNILSKLSSPSTQPNEGGVYKQNFAMLNVNGTLFF